MLITLVCMVRLKPVDTLSDSEAEREGNVPQIIGLPVDSSRKKQINALEIFAGSGHLTSAINRYTGVKCWSKDIRRCALEDLTRPEEWEMICSAIDTHFLDYIHLAPPCNTYSTARWPKIRNVFVLVAGQQRCVCV